MRRLAIAFCLLLCAPALAKVQLSADVGWNNRFRPGRWTPVYVTLQDSSPRQVDVQLYAPTDRRYAMKVSQSVAIGPQPVTVAMYVPLSFQLNETTATVLDTGNGRLLAHHILSDFAAYPGQQLGGPEAIDPTCVFFGISGNAGTERLLSSQLNGERSKTGFVSALRLPAVPAGYDAIDALILNQPDLSRVNLDQQRAIAEWVRAGGTLIVLPGADPFPDIGPIADLLPARIGDNRVFQFTPAAIASAGLPARFANLKGRALTPFEHAAPIALLGSSEPAGFRQFTGFGTVILFAPDLSQLVFNTPEKAQDFWRAALAGGVELPVAKDSAPTNYYWGQPTRRAAPLRKALDWISDIPGAGQFGFGYLATVLIALMVVVGPVDWFVLKWTGKQPWTWVTVTGWIGLVTLAGIYLGHIFKAGDLYFRTVTVIDEADGLRVAVKDLVGIYSPQTRLYQLSTEPQSWWQPASDNMSFYGSGALQLAIPCHQDYRGNRPAPLLINVWNMRLLEGMQFGPAAPLLEARIQRAGDRLTGKIANLAPFPLTDVHVRARDGVARIDQPIAPGATLDLDVKLDRGDTHLSAPPPEQDPVAWQRYSAQTASTTQPTQAILSGLSDQRAVAIDRILQQRADVACLYASFDAPPQPRAALLPDAASQSHVGLVRSLVNLEQTSR